MSLNLNMPAVTMQGYYKLVVTKADGTKYETEEFPNLITNVGMNSFGEDYIDNLTAAYVGTGSTIPANTDVDLTSILARTRTIIGGTGWSVQPSEPYYTSTTRVHQFDPGSVVGTITEVGIGWYTQVGLVYTYYLFSHALILDGEGNPTSITLTSEDTLDIIYTVKVYPPASDTTGTVVLNGITYNWTSRIYKASETDYYNYYGNWLLPGGSLCAKDTDIWGNLYLYKQAMLYNAGSLTTNQTDTVTGSPVTVTMTGAAYVADSYSRDVTFAAGLTQGNLSGGIKTITFGAGFGAYQIGFTPNIPKDGTCTLTLTFTHSWARKEP